MDPEGKISEQKRKQSQSDVEILAERLLDGEGISADKWTTSLKDIPTLTHAVVEDFFKQTNKRQKACHRGLCVFKDPEIRDFGKTNEN